MNQKKEYRDVFITGLAFGICIWAAPGSIYLILWIAIPTLLLIALIEPLRRLNHQMWHYISLAMQTVMHPVLFSIIYFFALVPIGVMYRLFRREKKNKISTFVSLDQEINKEFFEVPW